jgi:phosphatidate cytidylyltransferase
MKDRIIAAFVALCIVLPILIFGGFWGIFGLVLVVTIIGTNEILRILLPESKQVWWLIYLVYLSTYVALCISDQLLGGKDSELLILVIGGFVLWICGLFLGRTNEEGMDISLKASFGLLYVPFLLSFFPKLRSIEDNGLAWVFFALLLTWSADTGAYFAGRSLGKNKLFERVSPKKTTEGAIGGLVLTVVVALVYQSMYLPSMGYIHALILGVMLCLLSIVGDLVESMIKRATGVKDSGNIMPGHGGIIDRLDSMLFTLPTTFIYYSYVIA